MRKSFGLFTIFSLLSFSAFATPLPLPKTATTLDAFVPAGWFILKSAHGDLNKDSQDDNVLILASATEKTPDPTGAEKPNRQLVLLFKNTSGGYDLAGQSDKIIMCQQCGGMLGDPLQSLEIEHGTFVLTFYGGSRDRWGYTYRFRFQNSDWYLIGETDVTADNMELTSRTVDMNLVTGVTVIDDDNKGKVSRQQVKSTPKPLKRLADIDAMNQ